MKFILVDNPILRKNIAFFINCSYKEFEKEVKLVNPKKHGIQIKELDNAIGVNYRGNDGMSIIWISNKLSKSRIITAITHEILHAVVWQFKTVDIPIYWENDEILCYTQEYFLQSVLDKLYPKLTF